MGFDNIYKRVSRSDESIYLMKLTFGEEVDELGFAEESYKMIQELNGIIQRPQELEIDTRGQESEPAYIGYFKPEFNLKTKELNNYRIKYIRPYETIYMKITEYNPNLFLGHNRHHIRLKLILEKKI